MPHPPWQLHILLFFSIISAVFHMLDFMRPLHSSYFFTEAGLFFSSEALGLVFSAMYLRGSFAPSAFPRQVGACGFPHRYITKRQHPYASHFRKDHPLFLGYKDCQVVQRSLSISHSSSFTQPGIS
jgi:hypothetical protein